MLKKLNFNEFPKSNRADWEKQLEKDLRGKTSNDLTSMLEDGLDINPIYTIENLESPKFLPSQNVTWNFAQTLQGYHQNNDVLYFLNKGINEITLEPYSLDSEIFKDVNFSLIHCNILGENYDDANKVPIVNGSVIVDVINASLKTGNNITSDVLHQWKSGFSNTLNNKPNINAWGIDLLHLQQSGASAQQQIAALFGSMAEYLNLLGPKEIETALEHCFIRIGVSKNYFLEIAKIRAIRHLYAGFCDAYSVSNKYQPKIYVQSSISEISEIDEKTNLLRLTTMAMSAVIGGADAISLLPFNANSQKPTELGNRLSVNIQHLMKEEAHLNAVADASEGAYFIEDITQKLADKSWQKFLDIEQSGGYISALKDGWFQHEVLSTAAQKVKSIEENASTIIGANKYLNNLQAEELKHVAEEVETFTDIIRLPQLVFSNYVSPNSTSK